MNIPSVAVKKISSVIGLSSYKYFTRSETKTEFYNVKQFKAVVSILSLKFFYPNLNVNIS